MKLKKKYKVILGIFIVAFIGLSIFLVTKKEKITTTKKTSKANEYLISYSQGSDVGWCAKYNSSFKDGIYRYNEVDEGYPAYVSNGCITDIKTYINQKGNGQAACDAWKEYATLPNTYNQYDETIVSNYNNNCVPTYGEKIEQKDINTVSVPSAGSYTCNDPLEQTSPSEPWPYYSTTDKNNGEKYGYTFDKYIELCPDKITKACNVYKKYIDNRGINSTSEVKKYNDACGTITEKKEAISWGGSTCSELKNKLEYYYADFKHEEWWYNQECIPNGYGNINIQQDSYKTDDTKCETTRINRYGGQLAPTMALEANSTSYACDFNMYFYKGQPYKFEDIFKTDATEGELTQICEAREKEVMSNGYSDVNTYNAYCYPITGKSLNSENYTVIFDADTGYGIKCPEIENQNYYVESGDNKCIYHFPISNHGASANVTIKLPDAITPEGSKMYQSTTGKKFGGWNINGSCVGNTTSGAGTSASIKLPDDSDITLTYTPCFEDRIDIISNQSTLYTDCKATFNRREKTDTKATTEYTKITESDGHKGVANSALIRNSSYSKKIYDGSKSNTTYNNNNEYCSVTCEENFNYLYPTIFETVKSGRYFDLISYPKVESTYKCTESFSYTGWKKEYDKAVKEERQEYIRYKNAESIENARYNDDDQSYWTSCGEDCTRFVYKHVYTSTINWYYLDSNDKITHSSNKSISYTDYEKLGISEIKGKIRANKGLIKDCSNECEKAKSQYETARGKRTGLETLNHNCEVTLISKSDNSTISNAFYRVEPQIDFIYQTDTTKSNNLSKAGKDGSNYARETLDKNINIKDNLADIKKDSQTELKDTTPVADINEIYGSAYRDKCGSNCASNYYKTDSGTDITISREVNLKAIYNHSATHQEYYVHGETVKPGNELSSAQKKNYINIGYVYPVDLSIHGSRNVYFLIDMNSKSSITDTDFGVQNLLKNTTLTESNKTNLYKCDYDITNDVIIHDEDSDKDDDYKKNFYIRSVETSNIDPNNRTEIGLMGANWASEKGKSLMNLIEYKSQNNNTQNPKNLEYSFTIDAQTIGAIKSYNETHKYDNFDDEYSKGGCECNNAGNECKCKFIQDLKDSKIINKNYNGVNPYVKSYDEIFKYYVASNKSYDKTDYRNWVTKKDYDKILKMYKGQCKTYYGTECSSKEYYEYIWRVVNEGVLP